MLEKQFDLTTARFPNFESVIIDELTHADFLVFDTYVPSGVYHSAQLNWKGDLTFFSAPKDFIRSKREREQVERSKAFFLEHGYEIRVEEVDEKKCQEFMDVYAATTLKKDRAIDYNANIIVQKNLLTGVPVYLFGLYKDNKLESGLLVSAYKEEFRVMFGAKKRFDQIRGGIGGVLEMELIQFCFEKKIPKISHGLSANPAGITDNAGIFEFKTRYGFTAFPVGEWRTTFILNKEANLTELVFLTVRDNQLCYHVLGKDADTIRKYQSRLVTQVSFQDIDEHIAKARQLFHL
ncbi:hypothetical protein H3C70_01410 [Patescibacteria group bacterium]|nr:hypothetical protein [Patescibacteria group bacterium]